MLLWVTARAIELCDLVTNLACVAHLRATWFARYRVFQIIEALKLPIAPECSVDAEVELRARLAIRVLFHDVLNCLNIEKSCVGTCFETFRDDFLGEGVACDPGGVEVMLQRDLIQQSSRAWGIYASSCSVDDFRQFLV